LGLEEERVCTRLNNLHIEYDIGCMAKKNMVFWVISFSYVFFILIPFIS